MSASNLVAIHPAVFNILDIDRYRYSGATEALEDVNSKSSSLSHHETYVTAWLWCCTCIYFCLGQPVTMSFCSILVLPRALFCSHHVPEHRPEGKRLSHCLP